jgi:hypothetical protein
VESKKALTTAPEISVSKYLWSASQDGMATILIYLYNTTVRYGIYFTFLPPRPTTIIGGQRFQYLQSYPVELVE